MSSVQKNREKKIDFPVFNSMFEKGHEQVTYCKDPSTGLKVIVAIHDTTLGPGLGGVRMLPYQSEAAAMDDVLRLSRGMTYKAAISGLNLGGGKAVIIGDPKKEKREALFRAFGRFVNGLGGRYITAQDAGISTGDIEWIRMETPFVVGIPEAFGGSGDPSPVTARGTYMGMKAAVKKVFGSDSLKNKRISIQGAGHVSSHLARYLQKEGAVLFLCDIDKDKEKKLAEETGAAIVKNEDIYGLDVDVFCPCALGGILNSETIPLLKCAVIAGAANNQIHDEEAIAPMLMKRNILFAPDYVINAGGLINVSNEIEGYNRDRAMKMTDNIYDSLTRIFHYAEKDKISTIAAANLLAKKRIDDIGRLSSIYAPKSPFNCRPASK